MQWHQLDCMQTICTSLQTENHINTLLLNFYRPDAVPAGSTPLVDPTNFCYQQARFSSLKCVKCVGDLYCSPDCLQRSPIPLLDYVRARGEGRKRKKGMRTRDATDGRSGIQPSFRGNRGPWPREPCIRWAPHSPTRISTFEGVSGPLKF